MVTGCTSNSEETTTAKYTIEQVRQDPIDVVTETTDLLPAEGWSSKAGGPWPGECSLEDGEDGAYYAFTLYSETAPKICMLMSTWWPSIGKASVWTSGSSRKVSSR